MLRSQTKDFSSGIASGDPSALGQQGAGEQSSASVSLEPPCGVVAKKMGDEAMRSFMKRDSDNHWDGPDCRQIDGVIAHDFRS
jgi:hypothetical protein